MLNKVVLIGRLTKDPDLKYTQSGVAVAKFTLAVERGFRGRDGEKQTDFISVIVWRGAAESCGKYLSKGRLVAVAGRIQTGHYDKDGQRHYTTEVVADEVRFLEFKKEQEDTNIPGFNPVSTDEELPF